MKSGLLLLTIVIAQSAIFQQRAIAQGPEKSQSVCKEWDKRVDPSLGAAGVTLAKIPGDAEVLVAMQCLLRHQGNKRPARCGGVAEPEVSQLLPTPSVELASLYYISYLFTMDWEHGDGIALWNREGVINPSGSIDTAYLAYKTWFERVKSTGLAEARKQRLDPLEGTGLHWYGK